MKTTRICACIHEPLQAFSNSENALPESGQSLCGHVPGDDNPFLFIKKKGFCPLKVKYIQIEVVFSI